MRRELERKFITLFKLGAILHEMRKENNMTQEQLAAKCGTMKTCNSLIDNNASDIRLFTLMRIVWEDFGKHLKLTVD